MRIALAIALATLGCSDSKKSSSPTNETSSAQEPAVETPAPTPMQSPVTDRFGPKLTALPEWKTCASPDDCAKIYSGCGMHSVVVNKMFETTVKKAWLKACGDRPMIGVVPAPGSFECVEGQCKRATDAPAKPPVPPSTKPSGQNAGTGR